MVSAQIICLESVLPNWDVRAGLLIYLAQVEQASPMPRTPSCGCTTGVFSLRPGKKDRKQDELCIPVLIRSTEVVAGGAVDEVHVVVVP